MAEANNQDMYNYLDDNGLLYLWQKLKVMIPTKGSDLTNDLVWQSLTEVNALISAARTAIEAEIPTRTSELTNDSTWQTLQEIQTLISNARTAIEAEIPTAVSDLTNDLGFQTLSQVETLINNAISGITGIEFVFPDNDNLPRTGVKGSFYFIHEYTYTQVTPAGSEDPSSEGWYEVLNNYYILSTDTSVVSGKAYYTRSANPTDDGYLELVWVTKNSVSFWEVLGHVGEVDLSGYVKATQMHAITNAEIDVILAS